MKDKQIIMGYGFLQPKISTQLKKQKFKFEPTKVKEFQDDLEHMRMLRIGYLTDKMWDAIIAKLHNKVCKHVAQMNKLKIGPPLQTT